MSAARLLLAVVGLAGCYDLDELPSLYHGDGGTAQSLTLIAGTLGGAGAAEGMGADGRLDGPEGACKSGNDVFVLDGNSTIWKVSDGAATLVAGRPYLQGSVDGPLGVSQLSYPIGCVVVGDDLYVSDSDGDTVRDLKISTGALSTLVPPGRIMHPYGITYANGALYVADAGANAIVRVDPASGSITAIAGGGAAGYVDNTDGAAARFNAPAGLTSDGAGRLFVADQGNQVVRSIALDPPYSVSLIAGVPGMKGAMDGAALQASFTSPRNLDLRVGSGILYVTDNAAVRTIDLLAGQVALLAGTVENGGSADGPAATAAFSATLGVAAVDSGDVFVADAYNSILRRISGSGASTIVSTEIGTRATFGLVDGPGSVAQFFYPEELLLVGDNVLIADSGNHVIRQIDPSGIVTTVAGGARAVGHDDGAALGGATFGSPQGLALGPDGVVYVSDIMFHDIRAFSGGAVTTIAGDPNGMSGDSDGVGPAASFHYPYGLAVVGTTLYVADGWNDAIRQIDLASGMVTTLIDGRQLTIPSCAGGAGLRGPWGLAADPARGTLYVAGSGSCSVAAVDLGTQKVALVAGGKRGTADGVAADAEFDAPGTLVLEGDTLYLSDRIGGTVRTIDPSTGAVHTLAGVPERHAVRLGPLPARLNGLSGLAFVGRDLFVGSPSEHSILRIR